MKRFFLGLQCTLIVCSLAVAGVCLTKKETSRGSNWPGWRGPGSQGVSSEKNLPTEWGATKNIAWKTPLPGRGHSSPVVWENRIFLTAAIDGDVIQGAKAVEHMDEGK